MGREAAELASGQPKETIRTRRAGPGTFLQSVAMDTNTQWLPSPAPTPESPGPEAAPMFPPQHESAPPRRQSAFRRRLSAIGAALIALLAKFKAVLLFLSR